eukprot:TRINITY_DN2731_c0_g1_i2.p2 TRINITY_DN2731_c0_g1~~TRINITY_DN2731_c0_g1_i2.p2  ORF type:complete len:197 (-),score=25.80 TRINITY_DN2731_c0_g1_i2:679-1269(-)
MSLATAVKAVILGDGAVGKTTLLIVYTTDAYPEEYIPTVFDNYSTILMHDGHNVNLGLWDTAGGEDYDRLRPLSYPQTDVFLLCFSVASPPSFENISSKWSPEIAFHCPEVPFIIVGMKTDLRNDAAAVAQLNERYHRGAITKDEGERLAEELNAYAYIECSSRQPDNVKEVFEEALNACFYKESRRLNKKSCTMM